MDTNCARLCPIVDICTDRHEKLTSALESYENSERLARSQYTAARAQSEQADEQVALNSMELDLLDCETPTLAPAAERAASYNEGISEYSGIRDNQAAEATAYEDLLVQYTEKIGRLAMGLELSQRVMATLDEAQQECPGPRLSIGGYLRWGRVALRDYRDPTKTFNPQATTLALMMNGFARCASRKARDAATINITAP